MSRRWTDNQARAIEAWERDVCVSAGAGSGKTGVLVERFVRIVRDSLDGKLPPERCAGVGEILVITFTDKATKEMKGRIVEALNAANLREQRREVETAYISTIHSFCSRLLKENPFEAGVDPEFQPLDETQARYLLRAAFESVIERAYRQDETEITELVAAAQDERVFGSDLRDPLSALADSVEAVLDRVRGAGWRQEEVAAHWRAGRDVTAARSLAPVLCLLNSVLNELNACVEALRVLRAGVADAIEGRRRAILARAEGLGSLPEASGWERVAATLAVIQEVVKEARAAGRARPVASMAEQEAREVFERIKLAARSAESLYNLCAEREEQAALLCHRFWGLLAEVWAVYTDVKRVQGVLDHDDLQAEAVHLLETSPGVLRRYQRRFRYLMVDEFQDTNPLQMRLIDLLHRSGVQVLGCSGVGNEAAQVNTRTSDHPPNNLFVVGDFQQSIYGFRNADVTLFQRMVEEYRANGTGEYVPLSDNFRSRPEILRFVNRLFAQIWRDASPPFTPLETGAKHADKDAPSIEFLLMRDPGRAVYHGKEAEALAARLRQMVEGQELRITDRGHARCGEPIRYGDIAILFRSLTDIEKYENVFARRGVPYFVVGGGRGYYARREVRDVMNVLTVLDTPLDDIALAATLRSPMVGLDVQTLYALARFARTPNIEHRTSNTEHRTPLYPAIPAFLEAGGLPEGEADALRRFYEMIEALRAQEDRLPVGHLLERILEATQYDARLLVRPGGRRRLANIRKLLQMASAASVHGVADFIRRLREIEKVSDREGDAPTEEEAADVVRLMTIHKAKGLEFPVVFLADMGRSLVHLERSVFLCDPKALVLGCRLGDYKTAAYRAVERQRQEADQQESARLLYVALTRAREHLVLCGSLSSKRRAFNWADAVFPLVGVLSAPEESETRPGAGGVALRLISMDSLAAAGGS